MTSLARQLERLKVPGTQSRLGRDTHRTSLIFDPKEAANEDRLSVYHLGMKSQHYQTLISVVYDFKCRCYAVYHFELMRTKHRVNSI